MAHTARITNGIISQYKNNKEVKDITANNVIIVEVTGAATTQDDESDEDYTNPGSDKDSDRESDSDDKILPVTRYCHDDIDSDSNDDMPPLTRHHQHDSDSYSNSYVSTLPLTHCCHDGSDNDSEDEIEDDGNDEEIFTNTSLVVNKQQ